jgi:hypothetical protein
MEREELEEAAREVTISPVRFYQTANLRETVAVIMEEDGWISIGFARAGRTDIEKGLITSVDGMKIAKGRALKAREGSLTLLERNYLRGISARRVHMPLALPVVEGAENDKEQS